MIKIRFTLTAAAAALALAACEPDAAREISAPAPTPSLATPSDAPSLTPEGWGPLRIGMSREEVVAALGGPAGGASDDPEADVCEEFRPERAPDAVLVMLEEGRLTRISLIEPSDITTEQGFSVGVAADGVKAALGAAAVVEPHKYEAAPAEYILIWNGASVARPDYVTDPAARGLVFEVGRDGAVRAIRAGGPSIQYVEGCA